MLIETCLLASLCLAQLGVQAVQPGPTQAALATWTFDLTTSGENVSWIAPSAIDPDAQLYNASCEITQIELGVQWNGIDFPIADVTHSAPPEALFSAGSAVGPAPFDVIDETILLPQPPDPSTLDMHLRLGMDASGFLFFQCSNLNLDQMPVDMGAPLGLQMVDITSIHVVGNMTLHATWFDLGKPLGVPGQPAPNLRGLGTLAASSQNEVQARNLEPDSIAFVVASLDVIAMPFKGGTIIPAPDQVAPVAVNASGSLSLPFLFPPGVPSDLSLYAQVWAADPSGPQGFIATNGLRGDTP